MTPSPRIIAFFCCFLTLIPTTDLPASGFDRALFSARREKLMQEMGEGVAVFKNSPTARRSNDVNYYPFRPNSNFYYLSGFEDPDAAFLLVPGGEKKFIMFVRPRNASSSQWFGDVPGIEDAMEIFGADTAYPADEFENVLRRHLYRSGKVYFDLADERLRETIIPLLTGFHGRGPDAMVDIARTVHDMRVVKDETEIALVREAVRISCDAHLEAMKAIGPGMHEYEVASIFSYVFEKNGSPSKAYESIVASGPNATIYHYSDLDRTMADGEMLLMDMGAEWNYYTSDITRVVPVNGKFTPEQKRLYELVVEMEDSMIAHLKPGNRWYDCLKLTEPIAKRGLHELGLITDPGTRWQHLLYYYPYSGHGVGLDVHDVGDYGSFPEGGRTLEPGMIFAVEPLLYVGENLIASFRQNVIRRFSLSEEEVDRFLDEIGPAFNKYRQVAARVEDDVLITPDGNEVLSKGLPRSVEEIERTMAQRSYLNEN